MNQNKASGFYICFMLLYSLFLSFFFYSSETNLLNSQEQQNRPKTKQHKQRNDQTNATESDQPSKAKVPIWLNNDKDNSSNTTKKTTTTKDDALDRQPQVQKSKTKKSGPVWLTSTTSKNNSTANVEEESDDDDFLGIRSSARQTKSKKDGPVWLTSTSTKNKNSTANVDESSDDDFLGIRSSAKKHHKQANAGNNNLGQMKSSSSEDMDLNRIFGRRGLQRSC